MESITIYQITSIELDKYISSKIDERVNLIQPIEVMKNEHENEYYTRKEVCDLLRISLVTLNKHTKSKRLNAYRIGSRVLYKKSEIMKSLSNIK